MNDITSSKLYFVTGKNEANLYFAEIGYGKLSQIDFGTDLHIKCVLGWLTWPWILITDRTLVLIFFWFTLEVKY